MAGEIHALYHGQSLCSTGIVAPQPGHVEGVPSSWPEGHSWVSIDQDDLITCTTCRRALEACDVVRAFGKVVLKPKYPRLT